MNNKSLRSFYVFFIFLFISVYSNAALIDRGGGFIYDSDLDITWYQNANLSGVITSPQSASSWAGNLVIYDSVRSVYWDDWRLPEDDLSCGSPTCVGSEMGHLFYSEGISVSSPGPFQDIQTGFYWFGTPVEFGARSFEFNTGITALDVSYYDPAYAWAVRDGDVVPIPAAFWLFLSSVGVLVGFKMPNKNKGV